jgi:hypothetical protein
MTQELFFLRICDMIGMEESVQDLHVVSLIWQILNLSCCVFSFFFV